jgi:hypothetical protein
MAGFFAQVRDGQPLEPVLAQLIAIAEKPRRRRSPTRKWSARARRSSRRSSFS